jgi:arsenite oxidase small subunit
MAEGSEGAADGRRAGLTRKQALVGGGAVVAAGATASALAACGGGGGEKYPRTKIAKVSQLQTNKPVDFDYPLDGQKGVLVDLGQEVPNGVGHGKSIVAFSVLCQHMGCPVGYLPDKRHFLCGCHQSEYDPAREGYVIQGVAQRPLPQVKLDIDGDDIFATGVEGLIYGYRDNLSPGKKAA